MQSKTRPGETLRPPVQDGDQPMHSGRDSDIGRQALPQKSQTGADDMQQKTEKDKFTSDIYIYIYIYVTANMDNQLV